MSVSTIGFPSGLTHRLIIKVATQQTDKITQVILVDYLLPVAFASSSC